MLLNVGYKYNVTDLRQDLREINPKILYGAVASKYSAWRALGISPKVQVTLNAKAAMMLLEASARRSFERFIENFRLIAWNIQPK